MATITPAVQAYVITPLSVAHGGTGGRTLDAAGIVTKTGSQTITGVKQMNDVNIGASGTAGAFDIFPSTASKGKFTIAAANNTGNTTFTLTNAEMGQATTVTIPDPGASAAKAVLTSGTATMLTSSTTAMQQVFTSFGTVSFDRSVKVARVALSNSGTGVFSWANPEAGSILIHRVLVDVTTDSSASVTMDVGTTATSSSTSSDNLLDGLDIDAAAGLFDNITEKGSNGKSRQKLATGKWVTGTASGTPTSLVGYAYIYYINL